MIFFFSLFHFQNAGSAVDAAFNPLLLALAAVATLLALAVAGILAALYRKHSAGQSSSPKHAPIVCEPPNPGSTTPIHPQTKQPVDDIDPDIIPNEYGTLNDLFFFNFFIIFISFHLLALAIVELKFCILYTIYCSIVHVVGF